MSQKGWKSSALIAAASIALMGVMPVAGAEAAAPLPINPVPCGRNDFLQLQVHLWNSGHQLLCYANGGETNLPNAVGGWWLTEIKTGNNRVQWFGDGRWQPASAINKWTTYNFPNNPGGVRIERIRII